MPDYLVPRTTWESSDKCFCRKASTAEPDILNLRPSNFLPQNNLPAVTGPWAGTVGWAVGTAQHPFTPRQKCTDTPDLQALAFGLTPNLTSCISFCQIGCIRT